jgi:integrase
MATTIKDNGLPAGSGLFWKNKDRTQIWIRISHKGVAKSYPSGTTSWKKALLERDRLKAGLIKGDKSQTAGRAVRVNELLDDYIAELERKGAAKGEYGTENAYKVASSCSKHIRPFFGGMKAAALTTDDLNKYRDMRIAQYRKQGKPEGSWIVAINREFAYLRAAFRMGTRATPKKVSSYPHFPVDAKGERLRARKGVVTQEQFSQLMAAAADHLKPVLPLVTYGGIRAKEVKFIRREQVDWEHGVIHLRDGETKEGLGRDVPIVDVAVEPLRKWMDYSAEFFPGCPWVFNYLGKRVTTWKTAWNAACRRSGLVTPVVGTDGKPKMDKRGKPLMRNLVKFHDTRRTAITIQGRAGVTEADSQRVTGHGTVEVHRRYDQDKDAAMRTRDAVNAYMSGKAHSEPQPDAAPSDALAGLTFKELAQYRKDGLLTEEEFATAKARIFNVGK